MKSIYVITLIFFLTLKSYSQEYTELVFNNQLNNLVTEKLGYAPTVFEVDNKEYKSTTKTSSKRVTQAYKDAIELVKIAEKDSIEAAQNKDSELAKVHEIGKIKKNINKFLTSKDVYDAKKEMLIDAQKISNKYSLGYLIYADSQINKDYKSKFFVLSHNKLDLKIHLKKLLWKIDSNKNYPAAKVDNSLENNRLKQAREKFKSTKKYEIIQGKSNVRSYNVLTLGKDVINSEEQISGHFESLGEFYVVTAGNGYKSEQLVPAKEVKAKKIKKENFVFEIPIVLIQHSITKSTYVVSPGFIEEYAINRIASQDKFKDRTSFPQKIYRNEEDKKFDSLIFDYNKSQIASMTNFD